MTALAERLKRRIALEGPLSVADYMAESVTCYYAGRDPLGTAGDFTTAPEISQMFGELIGAWCADVWQRLGRPLPVRLVELGPGRGTLMRDALRVIGRVTDAMTVHLVEASPALRLIQQDALGMAAWHERFDQVPDGPALIIANEFFDALPIRQFERLETGWAERRIAWDGGFRFVTVPAPAVLIPAARRDAPPGTVVEVSPASLALVAAQARRVVDQGGAALIVDYAATGMSLQAVHRHRAADPLATPGEADLSAAVDFVALAEAAGAEGAAVHGPVAQGSFLRQLGIVERARRLNAQAELERLTGAAQMGTLFQALAIVPPGFGVPAGFEP